MIKENKVKYLISFSTMRKNSSSSIIREQQINKQTFHIKWGGGLNLILLLYILCPMQNYGLICLRMNVHDEKQNTITMKNIFVWILTMVDNSV